MDRVRTAVVFALAGPPAGLLAMLAVALLSPNGGSRPDTWAFVKAAPALLAFAYLFGEVPALITGGLTAAFAGWADRPWRFAAAGAAAGFAVATGFAFLLKPLGGAADASWRYGGVGAFAGACCAGLVSGGRAWRRRPQRDIIIPPKT